MELHIFRNLISLKISSLILLFAAASIVFREAEGTGCGCAAKPGAIEKSNNISTSTNGKSCNGTSPTNEKSSGNATSPNAENRAGRGGNYYTSLIGTQDLARKEQEVLQHLIQYRRKLNDRLDLINLYLDDYSETIHSLVRRSKPLHDKYKHNKYPTFEDEDELEYVVESTSANPLMVFKLLRRFSKELTNVALAVTGEDERAFTDYIDTLPEELDIPEAADLTGAARGLLRLQETYQLPTHEMSIGRLVEKQTGCKLTAFDMHYISICAFNDEMFAIAMEWIYQAYQNFLKGDTSVDEEQIQKQLTMIRDRHNAEFLKFDPVPTNVFSNMINPNMSNVPHLYIPPVVQEQPLRELTDSMYDIYNFYALCRGETLRPPEATKRLRCWYSTSKSAYHLVSPFKVEMHSEDPPVFQIYELITDNDIGQLQGYARPNLIRAQVAGSREQLKKGGISSDVRTSSVAWLFDLNLNVSTRIPRIIERLTGLVVEPFNASEFLQISSYGSVGGFYTVHLDALMPSNIILLMEMAAVELYGANRLNDISEDYAPDFQQRGDRVATVMFYLSDVELGGGTAFPKIGVAAKAIKGSAVFWYNLKHSGEKERLMLHGGCPVLYGNKWVANKWIRYFDQFHVRKCRKDRP